MSAPARRRGPRSLARIISGALLALIALTLVGAGATVLWADRTQRDASGYFSSAARGLSSAGYAVTHDGTGVSGTPTGVDLGSLGLVRIRATGTGRPIFIGIAPATDVATYLANVAHSDLRNLEVDPFRPSYTAVPGAARPAPPASRPIWTASAVGSAQTTLTWRPRTGNWSVVVMNADGSRGVTAAVSVGANVRYLGRLAAGLLLVGALLLAAAVRLLIGGRQVAGRPADAQALPQSATVAPGSVYPVVLVGSLDEPLSRWLWIVKWLLAIPHLILLGLLAIAFSLLTVLAWITVLVTGRYPRGIFDFNLGVLRWSWRVGAYSFGALSTDRYPPFSLDAVPGYPATLDIAYPGRVSRGLALVRWVLAIPHLVIVGMFVGGGSFWFEKTSSWAVTSPWSGLIGLLALVSGVMLAVSGRYPRGLFDLIVGLNRWVFRVVAYASLMTNDYPPFRLDSGGDEPVIGAAHAVPAV